MLDKIFVYGTLLKQAGNMMATYLKTNGEFLGEAMMPGLLYKVDFYPGALYDPELDRMVIGEVYQLKGVEKVLEVLDTYEGYDHEDDESSLFVRREVRVLMGAETISCWAYLYNNPVDKLTPILSGDFLKYDVERYK